MMQKEYKLTTPDMNRLIGCYSHEIQNPEQPSVALAETLDPLFKAMENLASSKENDEAKGIWVTVPRGKISDWRTYKEAREYKYVKTWFENRFPYYSDQPTFDDDGFVIDPVTLVSMKEMVQEVSAANQMAIVEANVA